MFARLEGAQALDRRLGALPADLLAEIEAKAQQAATALAAHVRDEKLSGQALQVRSGALRASIAAQVEVESTRVSASVGSFGDVKYAAIQEYGGRTAAHQILPQKGKALAFLVGGAARFARSVAHPGSSLPARGYLRSSLDEARDAIVAEFAGAAKQAWDRA